MTKLSILIPALISRKDLFMFLYVKLHTQVQKKYSYNEIQILVEWDDGEITIGEKRNKLLQAASGKYVCFVDDDDDVPDNYIEQLMQGINKDVDCCSLTGIITFDGERPKKFIHYMDCTHYYETEEAYHRFPNHLNCIKATIAKQFKFPESNWGEDTDWATQIKQSGLIKTEHYISQVIYFYRFVNNKLK